MTHLAKPGTERRIREAVAAIYRLFDAPAPPTIDGCPCCISTRSTDVLLTTPLQQISGQALWRYVSGAFFTVGDQRDFRYLLPRILEISVCDPGNSIDPEIVLGKLRLAEWRTWKLDEQRAIEELVDAWFEQAFESDLAEVAEGWFGWNAESVLCGAARAGMPLDRWLVRLSEPDAALVLVDMKTRFPSKPSGFWEDAPIGFRDLSAILGQGEA